VSEATVTVPAVGKVKKEYVWAGVAVIGGVFVFALWKRRTAATEEVTDFYADTRTGSDLPTDEYTSPGSIDTDDEGGFQGPKTDVEWAQRVTETLTWYEPGYTSRVVGKYLAGEPLDFEEQTLIREAWAQVGKPPGNQRIVTPTTPPVPPAPPGPPSTKPGSGSGPIPTVPPHRPGLPGRPIRK
jgi:hypothetical protein